MAGMQYNNHYQTIIVDSSAIFKFVETKNGLQSSVVNTNIGFFELAVILEDSDKTLGFCRIVADTGEYCKFCGVQRSVELHEESKQMIAYI